jgi:hypothetical protein
MRSWLPIGTALVIAATLILIVPQSKGQTAPADAGDAWEYKVVLVKTLVKDARELDALVTKLEDGLNSLGKKGWELSQEVNGALVFQRRK